LAINRFSIFDFKFSIEELTSQAAFGDFRFSIEEMTSKAVQGDRSIFDF